MFVIGYDPDVVADALSTARGTNASGHAYLEKLVTEEHDVIRRLIELARLRGAVIAGREPDEGQVRWLCDEADVPANRTAADVLALLEQHLPDLIVELSRDRDLFTLVWSLGDDAQRADLLLHLRDPAAIGAVGPAPVLAPAPGCPTSSSARAAGRSWDGTPRERHCATITGVTEFQDISPTTLADVLGREQVMDLGVRPLWTPVPRVAGPAFTVRCPPGDNLMLHAAIHRAEPGAVIVVEAGDVDYALAGGNVCAVAQRNGIAAFVVDGVVRDLAEIRELGFPVFARGVIPFPGVKSAVTPLNEPVRCGGVTVSAGDIVVADEEGIVVTPSAQRDQVLTAARAKLATEATETLDAWEQAHIAKVNQLLED